MKAYAAPTPSTGFPPRSGLRYKRRESVRVLSSERKHFPPAVDAPIADFAAIAPQGPSVSDADLIV
jgi:hypothetical protein